jgi:dipeptide/tripeptide permease
LVWLAKEEPSPAARNLALRLGRCVDTLSDVLSRRTTWLGPGLAVVAGAAMEATGSVAGPMLIDRGLDKAAVGFFFAFPAVVCMGAGALLGGFISDGPRDRERTLAFAVVGLAGSVTLLATAASTDIGPPAWVVVSALAFASVFFGIYTASAYALFMEITDPRLGGTQFSAYMGGINLCSVWSGWVVGRLAGQFDYSAALIAMAAFSLLALPLLAFVRRARTQLSSAS